MRRAADEAVAALTVQVTERRAALTQVEQSLQSTQQQVRTLEEQGFRAGHDDDAARVFPRIARGTSRSRRSYVISNSARRSCARAYCAGPSWTAMIGRAAR